MADQRAYRRPNQQMVYSAVDRRIRMPNYEPTEGNIPDSVFGPRRKEKDRREWKPSAPWYPNPDGPFQNAINENLIPANDLDSGGNIPPQSPMLDIEYTECSFASGAAHLLEVTGDCKLWALLWSCGVFIDTYWMLNPPILVQRAGPTDVTAVWREVLVCPKGWRVVGDWEEANGHVAADSDPLPPEPPIGDPPVWMPPRVLPGSAHAHKNGEVLTTIYSWELVPPVTISDCWATATYQEMVTVTTVSQVGGQLTPAAPQAVQPPVFETRIYRVPGCDPKTAQGVSGSASQATVAQEPFIRKGMAQGKKDSKAHFRKLKDS